jgi:hypothetical protein
MCNLYVEVAIVQKVIIIPNESEVVKMVVNKGKVGQILTDIEQDVLTLLTKEFLTQNKIAIRRGCSQQAVSKVIIKLRKKGLINSVFQEVVKNRPTPQPIYSYGLQNTPSFPVEHQIRLHSQEFNIRILYKDQRYKEQLQKANTINIDGNTIRLYRNTLEVYSGHSFYADDTQKATSESFEYWNRLFARLENDLKITLVKSRSQNIKLVNQHYSEINNEFAKECEKKADKIRVYTTDDAKLWFLIDNSFNLHEAETVHPETAKQDMGEVIQPFFNDLRYNKPPLISEIWKITALNTTHQEIFGTSLELYNKQIQLHLNVLQNMDLTMSAIRNELKALKRPDPNPFNVIDYLFDNPLELARFKAMSKTEQNKILFWGKENE